MDEQKKAPAREKTAEVSPVAAPEVSAVPVIPSAPGGSDPMAIPPAEPREPASL